MLSRHSLAVILSVVGLGFVAQSPPADDPAWKWPDSRWRAVVGKVRAGRSLLPFANALSSSAYQ